MSKYQCKRCLKDFAKKCNYESHINRKIPCKTLPQKSTNSPQKSTFLNKSELVCNYCGKDFSRSDSLSRHIDGYCKVKKENDSKMEELLETMVKLKEDVRLLQEENAKYKNIITNNTQNIKIDNQTNNIINIVAYGQEDLRKISDAEYQRILRRGFNSVPAFMESLHFDKNKPENHNVYISNMRDDFILMYDGIKWRLKNREDTLQQLYEDKADILETKFEELLERLDENTIKMFKRFIKVRDTDEDAVKRIKKDLKIMLYENREMVSKNKCIK